MNKHYLNRYNRFIAARRDRILEGYAESHHIIPRAKGGSDDPDNLIDLTAREHFIAHWMLWRAYRDPETTAAFWMMSNMRKGRINSHTYQTLREDVSNRAKGNKNRLGIKHTPERIEWYKEFNKSTWTDARREDMRQRTSKRNLESGIKVTIDGVEYPSVREANRQTGIDRRIIMREYT